MNCLARALPIALALGLVACGDDPDDTAIDDGASAAGEVLEGSISDEMLPYDRLRSQPPLAEAAEGQAVERRERDGAAPDTDTAGEPAAPDEAAEAEPDPAAQPDGD